MYQAFLQKIYGACLMDEADEREKLYVFLHGWEKVNSQERGESGKTV